MATWTGWQRTPERRVDPRGLWPDVRSVIMLGVNYGPDQDPLAILKQRTRARDLGLCAGRRLSRSHQEAAEGAGALAGRDRGGDVKVFVDTAAVMEKPLAQAAGLGWQGKHTNLVSREFGSWLFLGAIFTTLDLPRDDAEIDHCGSCRACLDICPTAAFPAPYQLDARRCISYLTIEHKGPIPREFRKPSATASMAATIASRSVPGTSSRRPAARRSSPRATNCARRRSPNWRGSTMRRSARCSRRSPVKRIGRDRFVRNVLIAIGNSGDVALAAEAERLLDDASPLVRGAAVWALSQLLRARTSLRRGGEVLSGRLNAMRDEQPRASEMAGTDCRGRWTSLISSRSFRNSRAS